MGQNIPEAFQGSAALAFIISMGWDWKVSTMPNIELDTCPHCKKTGGGHCYMEIHGSADEQKKRDGLHTCHKCGKGGSLYSLKEHLGLGAPGGGYSTRDSSSGDKKVDPALDMEAAHQALLADEGALDYLMNGRGFSREIIERQKIGFLPKKYFKETGEVRAIVYPYLVNGNCVWWHYRTLPTMPLSTNKVPKDFISPTGWDAKLYNSGALQPGIKDITFVEGEANCIAAMDKGIEGICGLPGANAKKLDWIDTIDKLELERIYVCYDNDKVGQRAANEIASRIGVERCWRIRLPHFMVTTEEQETRPGKDLNEWFAFGGGTAEEWEQLKKEAAQFDVAGVANSVDVLDELMDSILGNGVQPKYKTKWPTLNAHVGFDVGDVIDIMAPEKIGKTTFALNLLEHVVDTYKETGVFICLEMTKLRMGRKYVCHKAGIADSIPKTIEEAEALEKQFLEAIPPVRAADANREGEILFCYPQYKTVEDIYNLIRDCIRRYGAKWVVLDNLQRLADSTPSASRNRTIHMSEISKKLSQISKDYNVQMIRVLQPNRIKPGDMVTTDNVDGSSQVAKDCDCMITLHRSREGQMSVKEFDAMPEVNMNTAFSRTMLVTVGLSRYSAGGAVTLDYDGATSTVREQNEAYVAKMKAEAMKGVGHTQQLAQMGITPVAAPVGEEITV